MVAKEFRWEQSKFRTLSGSFKLERPIPSGVVVHWPRFYYASDTHGPWVEVCRIIVDLEDHLPNERVILNIVVSGAIAKMRVV